MKLIMLQMEDLCMYYSTEAFSWTSQPPGTTAQAVKICQNSSKGAKSNSIGWFNTTYSQFSRTRGIPGT